MGASFECGLFLFLITEVNEQFKLRVKENVEFYESLDDFVSDISQKVSPNVKFDNIKNLFFYFGSFLMLVLLVYVIDIFVMDMNMIRMENWRATYSESIYKLKSIKVTKNVTDRSRCTSSLWWNEK